MQTDQEVCSGGKLTCSSRLAKYESRGRHKDMVCQIRILISFLVCLTLLQTGTLSAPVMFLDDSMLKMSACAWGAGTGGLYL